MYTILVYDLEYYLIIMCANILWNMEWYVYSTYNSYASEESIM